MKNYSNQKIWNVTQITKSAAGSQTSVTSAIKTRTDFVCTNGLLQGDFVTPQPNSFTKTVVDVETSLRQYEGIAYGEKSQAFTKGGEALNPPFSPVPDPDWAVLRDVAMSKTYAQLRGSANLAVDIAEGKKTLQMIRDTLRLKKVFADFCKNMLLSPGYARQKRRYPTDGQRRLDYVTSKWLEYRYGWMPLVYSIYDVMETVTLRHTGGLFAFQNTAGGVFEGDRSTGSRSYNQPEHRVKSTLKYRHLCRTFWRHPGTGLVDYTSLNPVSIAWELFPLSFVADWVVGISDWLSNWENYFIYKDHFAGGFGTDSSLLEDVYSQFGTTTELKWASTGYIPCTSAFVYRGTRRVSKKNRFLMTSLPMPSNCPRFKVNIDAKRQLDAAALFHQLVAKRVRQF